MPQPRAQRLAKFRLLPALILLGLGLPSALQAQSLQELYTAARVYDATYLAARSLAESARYKAAQADALQRPSASFTASATRADTSTSTGRDLYGISAQAGLQARHALINKANDATVDQAVKVQALALADLESAEQDLILRLAQAYFDVLAAQDALATTRASKAAITEQLASAKRNFEVGTATITDTREAQARFDLATAQEIFADNDLRSKRIALDNLVGRNGVQPNALATPVALPAVVPQQVEEWVTQGDSLHPSVRKTRLAQEIARLESTKARAGYAPTLDLVGSITTTENRGSSITASGAKPGNTATSSFGVQFSMPLYTGGAVENRLREAVVLEEKARNDTEAARRFVAQNTRVAFFSVQSGLAQVRALEAAESSSKLALEATQLGYKVGVRVNLDVLNSQTQLFQTQRDLAKARYDVIVGGLRLRQASGQLQPQDVGNVNSLLAR